jgi:low temperature requirement protein LtrA
VWWIWIGGTLYNERFETEDLSYRIFTFLARLPVAAMAVFVHGGLGESTSAFALSYAAGRGLITIMWLRGGYHDASFRQVAHRYGIGFGFSVLVFVLSAFVPAPWRFVLWGAGLLADPLTPVMALGLQVRLPQFSSKLSERFGLFVIIVLGETIVRVVQGVARTHPLSTATALTGALGMALAFGLWWVYFDFVARRRFKPGKWWRTAWFYLHLPLVMGIAAVGVGVLDILTLEGGFKYGSPDFDDERGGHSVGDDRPDRADVKARPSRRPPPGKSASSRVPTNGSSFPTWDTSYSERGQKRW